MKERNKVRQGKWDWPKLLIYIHGFDFIKSFFVSIHERIVVNLQFAHVGGNGWRFSHLWFSTFQILELKLSQFYLHWKWERKIKIQSGFVKKIQGFYHEYIYQQFIKQTPVHTDDEAVRPFMATADTLLCLSSQLSKWDMSTWPFTSSLGRSFARSLILLLPTDRFARSLTHTLQSSWDSVRFEVPFPNFPEP